MKQLDKLLKADNLTKTVVAMKIPEIELAGRQCEDEIFGLMEKELFDIGSASANASDLKELRSILQTLNQELAFRERKEIEKQLKLF